MSRFQFELAGAGDDADLRAILAATPTPGRMSVSFLREPSWFGAAVIDGFSRQVTACRDNRTGRVIGFGCRSLRALYVDGTPTTIGYLSGLRVLPEYRNIGLLARGYAHFHKLHYDGRTPYYLTTIAEGNETALRILGSARVGLPAYHPAGRYHTIAIALPKTTVVRQANSMVRSASNVDLPTMLEFLTTVGRRRQFFPVYRAEDFTTADGLLRGLDITRVLIAERSGRIVGLMGAWDQRAFRQQIVQGYNGWLRAARPLYNLWAQMRGRAILPNVGRSLKTLFCALPLVDDDDPDIFDALLVALQQHCSGGTWTHLLIGLHERDPLLDVARRFQFACYTCLLFLVCWADGDDARRDLDSRPPYLELGSL